MRRALRIAFAVAVGGATLLVARPADAAETFTWVAAGPGAFGDPANWEDASGDPGVPGPGDAAVITNPPGLVSVDPGSEVGTLTLTAPEDGALDLEVAGTPQVAAFVADHLALGGDVRLGGRTSTHQLDLSGTVDSGSRVWMRAGDAELPPGPGRLVIDGARTDDLEQGSFTVSGDETDLEVVGSSTTRFPFLTMTVPATVSLTNGAAAFGGTLFVHTDTELVGDVPAGASVIGPVPTAPGATPTLTWSGDDVELLGRVGVETAWRTRLPDALTVGGALDVLGSATGGDVALDDGARLTAGAWPDQGRLPGLRLRGAFTADPAADIVPFQRGVAPCVGDDTVLVRAAGGVTAQPSLDPWPGNAERAIEQLPLRKELVAIVRRAEGVPADDTCVDGVAERVVRSQFRDLLGRTADETGEAYWTAKLAAGGSPGLVSSRLVASDEAKEHLARQTYATWWCGEDEPSDLALGMAAGYLQAGGSLAVLRAEVVAGSVPGDGDPVDCLYQAVLGRSPDDGGRAYVEGRLETESVQRVARKMMGTAEGRRVQFGRLSRRLLGRPASADLVELGTAAMADGQSELSFTGRLAGTQDYVERASL